MVPCGREGGREGERLTVYSLVVLCIVPRERKKEEERERGEGGKEERMRGKN